MTSRDPSQMPVEQLAQVLLQCARADARLARRSPANDDPQHVRDINATCSNLEALPEFRRDPEAPRPAPDLSWPAVPASKAAINADLEALLAITLTSAQDAWHIARQAHEASRKARCGMFVAVGVAAIGFMVAAGAIVAALRCGDANPAGGGNRQAGAAPWRSAAANQDATGGHPGTACRTGSQRRAGPAGCRVALARRIRPAGARTTQDQGGAGAARHARGTVIRGQPARSGRKHGPATDRTGFKHGLAAGADFHQFCPAGRRTTAAITAGNRDRGCEPCRSAGSGQWHASGGAELPSRGVRDEKRAARLAPQSRGCLRRRAGVVEKSFFIKGIV